MLRFFCMINRIYNMNNIDLFREMEQKNVLYNLLYADMMFDQKSMPELKWIEEARRAASPTATIYIHTDQRSVCEVRNALIEFGWHLQAWVIFGYDWGGRARNMWGAKHDDILVATMDPKLWTFNVDAVSIPKATLINSQKTHKIPTDVWSDIGTLHTMSKEKDAGQHRKWQKPEKLLERIIKASSNVGDLVMDCFVGTGTTPVTAKRLKRNFIACDIEKVCCKITEDRLSMVQQ